MIIKIIKMFLLLGVGYISIVLAGTLSLTQIIFKNGK
jgi:hypothetical protein